MTARGRKELPEHEKRKHPITCRLTDAELSLANQRRGALTCGEWMRRGALASIPPTIPALNREAWIELARLSSNLNQIAKRLNQTGKMEVSKVKEEVEALRRAILNVQLEGGEQ